MKDAINRTKKRVGAIRTRIRELHEAIRLLHFYRHFPLNECYGLEVKPLLNESIDLITIAFNNPEMIQYQNRLLKKFITDSYVYTVADNSSDTSMRSEIRAFCFEQNIPYISLPVSPFATPHNSNSHGASLNYVYRNYIQPRKASRFALLDHDIFPICPVSLKDYLKHQPFYGMLQVCELPHIPGGRLLYLWPGLAIFDRTYTQGKPLNFLPKFGGDTGSGCFYTLYKTLLVDQKKESVFYFPDEKRINLWEGDDFQNDMYAYIGDDWLHVANASDWRCAEDFKKKEVRMKKILDDLLQ